MAPNIEGKQHSEEIENVDHRPLDAVTARGFAVDLDELPKGYYRSPYFLGTFFAIGFNLMASTGGFALIAPVLSQIAVSLGGEGIIWLSLVYTIGLAVGLTLVGRLTDIFSRRYFFIGGTILGMIGAIVASTAHTIPVLIGGQTLIGLSASTGYSYAFVIGELVPVKRRFLANAIIFIFSMPTAGFGAAVSTALILHTSPAWRSTYYLLIGLNGVTAALYAIFYFPPTFHQKHGRETIMQMVKNFDFVGLILYIAGLVLFILGLSSGGSLYPWKDAHTISFIVVGFLCLVALFVYETVFDLKEPLIPMHLFRNRGWTAAMLSLSFGASVYYSQAIVFPEMVANVYSNGRVMWAGLVSCLVGIGITVGEIIGGGVAKNLGRWKQQCIAVITIGTILLAVVATCNPNTPGRAMGLVFVATTFIGWNEALVLPICTIAIRDQQEIGTAAGIAGSSRSAISTVASTIYSVVLTARVGKTIPSQVPQAVIAAGLPASSVLDYMEAIASGGSKTALAAVKGLTPQILAAGARAYQHAYMDAYRTVFLVSIAFGGLGIIASFFIPDIDKLMSGSVAATLQGRNDGETLGERYHNKKVEA